MDDQTNLTEADQRVMQLSLRGYEWASAEGLLPQLSACLALVRPVSMTEDAAAEWLAVAANELAGYGKKITEAALSDARQRCTHHGQIIPHVIKYMEDATPWRMGKPLERRLPNQPQAKALASPEAARVIGDATRALSSRHPGHAD